MPRGGPIRKPRSLASFFSQKAFADASQKIFASILSERRAQN
jgi:hypothetical protein